MKRMILKGSGICSNEGIITVFMNYLWFVPSVTKQSCWCYTIFIGLFYVQRKHQRWNYSRLNFFHKVEH